MDARRDSVWRYRHEGAAAERKCRCAAGSIYSDSRAVRAEAGIDQGPGRGTGHRPRRKTVRKLVAAYSMSWWRMDKCLRLLCILAWLIAACMALGSEYHGQVLLG